MENKLKNSIRCTTKKILYDCDAIDKVQLHPDLFPFISSQV